MNTHSSPQAVPTSATTFVDTPLIRDAPWSHPNESAEFDLRMLRVGSTLLFLGQVIAATLPPAGLILFIYASPIWHYLIRSCRPFVERMLSASRRAHPEKGVLCTLELESGNELIGIDTGILSEQSDRYRFCGVRCTFELTNLSLTGRSNVFRTAIRTEGKDIDCTFTLTRSTYLPRSFNTFPADRLLPPPTFLRSNAGFHQRARRTNIVMLSSMLGIAAWRLVLDSNGSSPIQSNSGLQFLAITAPLVAVTWIRYGREMRWTIRRWQRSRSRRW